MVILQVLSRSALKLYPQWFYYLSSFFIGLWQLPIFSYSNADRWFWDTCSAYFESTYHSLKKNSFCTASYCMTSFMVWLYFSALPPFSRLPFISETKLQVLCRWELSVPRGSKWLRFSNQIKCFLTDASLADQFTVNSPSVFSFLENKLFSFVF